MHSVFFGKTGVTCWYANMRFFKNPLAPLVPVFLPGTKEGLLSLRISHGWTLGLYAPLQPGLILPSLPVQCFTRYILLII
jgi:hypothetical protein